MLRETVARVADTPRKAISVTRAGIAVGEDAGRLLREAGRRIDDVLRDVHIMREIVERLDGRVATLQQQVDAFNTRVGHVEDITENLEHDVEKATDRLPDPNKGTITKLRDAFSPSPSRD